MALLSFKKYLFPFIIMVLFISTISCSMLPGVFLNKPDPEPTPTNTELPTKTEVPKPTALPTQTPIPEPKTFLLDGCMYLPVTHLSVNAIFSECVTGATQFPEGIMEIHFKWEMIWEDPDKAKSLGYCMQKGSDAGNKNMFILDDLGNRYDHIMVDEWHADSSRGSGYVDIVCMSTVYGVFTFESFEPEAVWIKFMDDDNHLETPEMEIPWGVVGDGETGDRIVIQKTPTNTAEQQPVKLPGGKIVFSRVGDLYLIDPDGEDLTPLLTDAGFTSSPKWSPDGEWIVYTATFNQNQGIFMIDKNGRQRRSVINANGDERSPDWSPDGSWIVFTSNEIGEHQDIYRIKPDGSERELLYESTYGALDPTFTPDGKQIIFFEGSRIKIIDLGSLEVDDYYVDRELPNGFDFSPDGEWLVFMSRMEGDPEIYALNSDRETLVRVTNSPNFDQAPSWSPDGAFIVFASLRDETLKLYITNFETGDTIPLTLEYGTDPDWSP